MLFPRILIMLFNQGLILAIGLLVMVYGFYTNKDKAIYMLAGAFILFWAIGGISQVLTYFPHDIGTAPVFLILFGVAFAYTEGAVRTAAGALAVIILLAMIF